MSAAGWKPDEGGIQNILDSVKTSSTDTVEFAEYVRLMTPIIKNQDESERYRVGFHMFDEDSKGYITVDDLERVAKEIGESDMDLSEFEEMIKEAGKNGKVDFDSFVKIMQFTSNSTL